MVHRVAMGMVLCAMHVVCTPVIHCTLQQDMIALDPSPPPFKAVANPFDFFLYKDSQLDHHQPPKPPPHPIFCIYHLDRLGPMSLAPPGK